MLDRQSSGSLPTTELSSTSLLALWLFPTSRPLQPISDYEREWALQLPPKRARQYEHSRGYVRYALAEILKVPPLEIPLKAKPGAPPQLTNSSGYISFSHCCDALLVGWSQQRIGVDIERSDRRLKADWLIRRYFTHKEKEVLKNLNEEEIRIAVLDNWLAKEAAIKWQRGNISKDLAKWNISKEFLSASHNLYGYKVTINKMRYYDWNMAIACNSPRNNIQPIICIE